ncbi:MAG: hypothetical protein ACFFDP_04785 [Promethearchaeota archaeon]
MSFSDKFKEHWLYVIIMLIVAVVGVFGLLFVPRPGDPLVALLHVNVMLLGLSMVTVFLLWGISAYLFYRWMATDRKATATIIWALSYFVYGILFIAMCFQALGAPWADMNIPSIFFEFRQVMIWFLAFQWLGIAVQLSENKWIRYIPAILILGVGYIWFSYGLLVVGNIEYMMYGFTYGILIPVAFTLAYSFYLYGKSANIKAPYYLTIGFTALGVCYGAWAPWHGMNFYFIWFFLFVSSLIPIAMGFLLLSRDVELRKLRG